MKISNKLLFVCANVILVRLKEHLGNVTLKDHEERDQEEDQDETKPTGFFFFIFFIFTK